MYKEIRDNLALHTSRILSEEYKITIPGVCQYEIYMKAMECFFLLLNSSNRFLALKVLFIS